MVEVYNKECFVYASEITDKYKEVIFKASDLGCQVGIGGDVTPVMLQTHEIVFDSRKNNDKPTGPIYFGMGLGFILIVLMGFLLYKTGEMPK